MVNSKTVVLQLIEIIEMNIGNNLSIDKLSELSGYSKWHFQRLFQNYVQMNVGSYIRHRRLSKAAILLKQYNYTVSELAKMLGFSSPQSFTRSFQHLLGESPHKFRMNTVWDFSKQLPPFMERYTLTYDYISLPHDSDTVNSYVFFLYQSLDKERLRRIHSRTHELIPLQRVCEKTCQHEPFTQKIMGKAIECFSRVSDFSFPYGHYILISFHGALDEFYDFFKNLYEIHLPRVGVKVNSGFIIELYRESSCSTNEFDIGILISIENETGITSQ
ncbi:helix-turn-helix domain-containing protein [Serratia proteamaculans]|uniref:helix-turn-helix domain-containing protein n=1 Tax=Serratia proteamaculans TaxID=28151 RepID=UPI00217AAAEB|nr:helix-turn-helix domain-containing protein [Serratia proteamaculans]CAI1753572.1 right oriC-binding transcriptional activator [Serratia proteamaculans]CAI2536309.1 right oriC-binding transcriptional activator [Serratia proteamaculans]